MIFLYLILIIFLIIPVMLFVPINVRISYSKKIIFNINIMGIKINFSDFIKNKNNKKSKSSKSSNKKFKINSNNKFSLWKKLELLLKILLITKDTIKKIVKNISFKKFKLIVKIGLSDAANTAIKYGQASAFLYPLLEIIKEIFNPKNFVVNVVPDFLDEKVEVDFECEFSGNIFDIISVLMFVISRCYKCNII